MLIGSEGMLGVITEAWVRVRPRPRFRASAGVSSRPSRPGAQAVRALAQSGLYPSNCRLLDPGEAALTGAAPDGRALLVLGFESADHPLDAWLERALELCADHGGEVHGEPTHGRTRRVRGRVARRLPPGALPARHAGGRGHPRGDLRDGDHLGPLRVVRGRGARAGGRGAGTRGTVTCRLTHVYPDGAAPYFTVLAPARRGSELEQWARAQGGRIRGDHRRRRHDHPPPRRRARPPPLVRPPAPGAVRRGAARRQGRARPGGDPQSRRARGSGACAMSTASATSSGLTR